MITPLVHQKLISQLQLQVATLEEDLSLAEKDILDFEEAAKEWRNGFIEMETKYKLKLFHAEQTIDELRSELFEARKLMQT